MPRMSPAEERIVRGGRRILRGIGKRTSKLLSGKKSKSTSRKGKSSSRKGNLIYSERVEEESRRTQEAHKVKLRKKGHA